MSKNTALILLIVVSLTFIAGCSKPQKEVIYSTGQVIKETPKEQDACTGITCPRNQECRNGKCYCASGFRKCGDDCIGISACCTDEDCDEDRFCYSRECVQKCNSLNCDSNKICNASNECSCDFGDVWCSDQNKCIPANFCCTGRDCRGSTDCVRSGRAMDFCFESKETNDLSCVRIAEQATKTIDLNFNDFKVTALKIMKGNMAYVRIADRVFKDLKPDIRYSFDKNTLFYITDIRTYGGSCED